MNLIERITEKDIENAYIRSTVGTIEETLSIARVRGMSQVSIPIDLPACYSSEKLINLESEILSYFEHYNYIYSSYKNHLEIDFYLR